MIAGNILVSSVPKMKRGHMISVSEFSANLNSSRILGVQLTCSACEEWRALNSALRLAPFVKDAVLIQVAAATVKLGKLTKKEHALCSKVCPERT